MTTSGRLALTVSPLVASALEALRRATGMPVAMGGAVSAGSNTLVIDQLRGTTTRSLQQLKVDIGAGLGGKAVALARPSTVVDYLNASGITHEYDRAVAPEQLRAMLALPIRVGQSVRAVLYAATRDPVELGERVLRAAAGVANRLERDIEIEEVVRRRLAETPTVPAAERGELHAELMAIAGSIRDEIVRDRLLDVCARLWSERESSATILAPREVEVLRLVAQGCTNNEISERLGLLPNTVKSYLKHAMRKLDVTNRVQAVNRARAEGLLA